jgi:hypothetical protein
VSFTSLDVGPFNSTPSGNPNPSPGYNLRPGEHVQLTTALKPANYSITVTGVAP